MRTIIPALVLVLLVAACGQSYEETKKLTRKQRVEAMRKDSAALKIAVMPTMDCLPLFVAQHHQLYDTLNGGVRLKYFMAQMDCDTAIERGRVEGVMTDLIRATRMTRQGTALRYMAATNANWQLVANRHARLKHLKQLDDKMVAMTRYSVTDWLCDYVVDSTKIKSEKLFRVQINDVDVRLQMLRNNELDAFFMTEPQATAARIGKNNVLLDTRKIDAWMGVLAFREVEMRRPERHRQLELFMKAYNAACDSINKYGVKHYKPLIVKYCRTTEQVVDSLPEMKYRHAAGVRDKDVHVRRIGGRKNINDKNADDRQNFFAGQPFGKGSHTT